jgi:hypothetical protein
LHEGDPLNQQVENCQLTKVSLAKLTLKGEGDDFWPKNAKSHEGDPLNQKSLAAKASLAKLTLEGEGDAFQ